MTERDFRDYLDDILEHARKAKAFIAGVSVEDFLEDDKTQMAVAHAFVIIGEATKRIPEEFRLRHPDIPWREMAGMRAFPAHRYREVSPPVLFQTAAHNIDVVIARLPTIIAEVDTPDWAPNRPPGTRRGSPAPNAEISDVRSALCRGVGTRDLQAFVPRPVTLP